MSLAQARADYRRKLAVHKAAKKADSEKNYNNKMYKPRTFTVTCRYCKEEGHKVGHFDKELGRRQYSAQGLPKLLSARPTGKCCCARKRKLENLFPVAR